MGCQWTGLHILPSTENSMPAALLLFERLLDKKQSMIPEISELEYDTAGTRLCIYSNIQGKRFG